MIPLEQLSVYLPYGLTCYGASDIWTIHSMSVEYISFFNGVHLQETSYEDFFTDYSPLLHQLSKYKDVNSEHMNNLGIDLPDQIWINELANGWVNVSKMPFNVIQIMAKNHIDMFNWIDQGLAEPIKKRICTT